jgi:virginiamycin B lyase
VEVDHKTGIVWFSDTWSETIGRLDPRTGDMRMVNTGLHGNVALAPDGNSIWRTDQKKIKKYDTATVMDTGKPVKEYDLKTANSTYGNFLSWDGKYFGGGGDTIVWLDIQTGEIRERRLTVGGKGRGGFDGDGNMWIGGERLAKYDPKTDLFVEYPLPTPHTNLYSARADKNGDVWAGEMQGGRIARFNPKTYQWIEYVLPSPWSFDFNSWIDNSTTPPTFWYGDQYGYIVRVQPLE